MIIQAVSPLSGAAVSAARAVVAISRVVRAAIQRPVAVDLIVASSGGADLSGNGPHSR